MQKKTITTEALASIFTNCE